MLPSQILQMPTAELLQQARTGVRLFPSAEAMLDGMADAMAGELRRNNEAGVPTRWILPVGPVKQYFRLVDTCNAEGISWKNVKWTNSSTGKRVPFRSRIR